MKKYKVGIIGATGMVGQRFLLLVSGHPWFELTALAASAHSAGKPYRDAVAAKWHMPQPIPPVAADMTVFDAVADAERLTAMVDFVFCAVDMGKDEIRELEERYARLECPVVSNNSAHRWTPDVPMVVPEINPEDAFQHHGIVANPNCSTIITMVALGGIRRLTAIDKMVACTYQAVSGAGQQGITELQDQLRAVTLGEPVQPHVFPCQIVSNVIPQIGSECDNGYTTEEMKMQNEGRKIMHLPELRVCCTCVRVPVMRSHSISVTVKTERRIELEEARAAKEAAEAAQKAAEEARKAANARIAEIQEQMRACIQALERIKAAAPAASVAPAAPKAAPKPASFTAPAAPVAPASFSAPAAPKAPAGFAAPAAPVAPVAPKAPAAPAASDLSFDSGSVADEIAHSVEALVGSAEEPAPKPVPKHPVNDTTTSRFANLNLQFGRNYDPTHK